jgi:hypothetical protein
MKYALLLYGYEPEYNQPGTQEFDDELKAYDAFTADAGERVQGGAALEGSATARTLRIEDYERLVTDGPYAETKEQLGGFFILECADMDEALAWAAKIPESRRGAIEVRPVMEIP